jgi:putative transposase
MGRLQLKSAYPALQTPSHTCRQRSEYLSAKLIEWASKNHITLCDIQLGKPQQNPYIKRYTRTVRNKWLETQIFHSIAEVQEYATEWRWTYNTDRPYMGIGGITPVMKPNQYKMAA